MNFDNISKLLTGILTLGIFAAIAAYALLNGASEGTQQLLIGAAIAQFGSVVNYFFGSSAGSSAKDKTITDLTNKP